MNHVRQYLPHLRRTYKVKVKVLKFVSPHEIHECHTKFNMSCVEAEDRITPPVLEDIFVDFTLSCDRIPEIPVVLSAPSAEICSTIALSVHDGINTNKSECCELLVTPDSDHIQLVRHDEVLATISHDTSLRSTMMDPPMSLSHARTKIAEITWLEHA